MSRSKELFDKPKEKWKEAKEETDYKESVRREKKAEKKKSRQMWFGKKNYHCRENDIFQS